MSKRWLFGFFLIPSAILLIGFVANRSQEPAKVSVLVEDGESGRLLIGIPIEADGLVAETDDRGRVFFDNLSPGLATFKISFVDFKDFLQTVNIKRGENEEILFSLELVTAQVKGRVLDSPSGKPVAGAAVAAGGVVGETGPDGRFTLDEVVIGTPTIKVRKEGYEAFSLGVPLVKGVIKDQGDLTLTRLAN